MSDSGPISHVTVVLCPHIMGFYRADIPLEDHIVLTAECEVCGTVTATPPRPRPSSRYTDEDIDALSDPIGDYIIVLNKEGPPLIPGPDAYKQQCDESNCSCGNPHQCKWHR